MIAEDSGFWRGCSFLLPVINFVYARLRTVISPLSTFLGVCGSGDDFVVWLSVYLQRLAHQEL